MQHILRPFLWLTVAGTFALVLQSCNPVIARFMSRSVAQLNRPVELLETRIANPILQNPGIAVLWVGHATVLIQIHDKVFLTDPLFSKTVGMIVRRYVEPGLEPESIPHVDFTLISHTHFDHFSYSSLDRIPQNGSLLIPWGALRYT
ncbi:MAG: MBL fold metallo-hydrolase, partial [Bacteroidota bacterium]